MSKDKRYIEQTNNDYFKEILSFLLIIILLILLAGLGVLGYYGMLIVKLLFGEWSICIILYILVDQIYFLIKKKRLNIHSISFQGFIFVYLGVTLISHLTVYNELGLTAKNVFVETLKLYKSYISSFDKSYYVGGGLIGLVLFQITVFILGSPGVIILSLAFIVLGISNICNHSIIDMVKRMFFISNRIKTFKKKILILLRKVSNVDDNRKEFKRKNPSISMLDDIRVSPNHSLEIEISNNYAKNVKEYLLKEDPMSSLVEVYVGHTFSSLVLNSPNNNTIRYVSKITNSPLSFKYGDLYYIDYPNRFKELFTLKKALTNIDLLGIPLGIMPNKDIVLYDIDHFNSFLICGIKNSGVKTLVRGIIASIILIYKQQCQLKFWDLKNEYKSYFLKPSFIEYDNEISKIQKEINNVTNEYERRNEVLSFLNVSSYEQGNIMINKESKNIDLINPYYIFINIPLNALSSDALSKLNFLISKGQRVGIYINVITRDIKDLDYIPINQMVKIIFKLSDLSMSLKLTKTDIATNLYGKGEALIIENEKIRHVETPFLSISDFIKVVNRITF